MPGAERIAPKPSTTFNSLLQAFEETRAAPVALDLAAGGFADRPGQNQRDSVDGQAVVLRDRASDGVFQFLGFTERIALRLRHYDEAILALHFGHEGCHSRWSQPGVALGHGLFDVFGVVIAAANHQHILEPPHYEQFVPMEKSEIPRSQEQRAVFPLNGCPEGALSLVGRFPVTGSYGCSADPDFADAAGI